MTKKEFLRIYKSLSIEERNQMILHYNGEPYTWNPIWVEVENNTRLSKQMLRMMPLVQAPTTEPKDKT